jgi:hypothetical protein
MSALPVRAAGNLPRISLIQGIPWPTRGTTVSHGPLILLAVLPLSPRV